MSSDRNFKLDGTPGATEEVVLSGTAGDRLHLSSNFFFDPATGTYEPTPEFLEKGRDALIAAAKRLEPSFQRQKLLFKVRLFALKIHTLLVKIKIEIHHVLLKLGFK